MSSPKVFSLVRNKDVSGISGTGEVAWGCVFPDGTAVLRWHAEKGGAPPSTSMWNCVGDIERIHGHEGSTQIVYEETPVE